MIILFNDETKKIYPDRINEMLHELEREVNSFSFNPKKKAEKIMEDPYEKCLWMCIALEWIHFHTTNQVYVDGRNEYAMKTIEKLSGLQEYKDTYDLYFSGSDEPGFEAVAKIFCKNAPTLHRTLMQTMTAFFCSVIALVFKPISEAMEEYEGDEWWRMPLI